MPTNLTFCSEYIYIRFTFNVHENIINVHCTIYTYSKAVLFCTLNLCVCTLSILY